MEGNLTEGRGNVPSLADQPGKGNEDKGFLPNGRHPPAYFRQLDA